MFHWGVRHRLLTFPPRSLNGRGQLTPYLTLRPLALPGGCFQWQRVLQGLSRRCRIRSINQQLHRRSCGQLHSLLWAQLAGKANAAEITNSKRADVTTASSDFFLACMAVHVHWHRHCPSRADSLQVVCFHPVPARRLISFSGGVGFISEGWQRQLSMAAPKHGVAKPPSFGYQYSSTMSSRCLLTAAASLLRLSSFLHVQPGHFVIVGGNNVEQGDWWMGQIIFCEGSPRQPKLPSLFQVADVDTGVIKWINADEVSDVIWSMDGWPAFSPIHEGKVQG